MAESFHATLIRAVRDGVEFRLLDGLPTTVRSSADRISWYAHAVAFVDMKWRDASPKPRKGIAEALVTVTTAPAGDTPNWLSDRGLRHALMAWSFNSAARAAGGQSDPPEEIHQALLWVAKHSPTLSEVSDPVRLRSLLEATARRLDGIAASPSTAAPTTRLSWNT